MGSSLQNAINSFKSGKMIVVYDDDEREGEADLIFPACFATPKKIELLRRGAGGLICAAIPDHKAAVLHLPFFTDLLERSGVNLRRMSCKKTAYGDKPAFSIPINHCRVYTGITDNDRALTLKMLDEIIQKRIGDFEKEFYSPGHVFLLIGRGVGNRRGHTELALELGRLAGFENAPMVLCEMLGSGKALSKEKAKAYAKEHNLSFIEGEEVI